MKIKMPKIMGVLNVTEDSFSDGGKFFKTKDAINQAMKMIEEGADIIDIGGESTRPFSKPVSLKEEIQRVIPVILELAKKIKIPISIDTRKAKVAEKALDSGATIINDISAMSDKNMAKLAVKKNCPIILMHIQGNPTNMQVNPHYENLIQEIKDYLKEKISFAISNGVKKENIIIDPGLGFGKTIEHNFMILKKIKEFKELNCQILIGASKKSFIRKSLRIDEPNAFEVEFGTNSITCYCALNKVDIIRVHNVKAAKSSLLILDRILND